MKFKDMPKLPIAMIALMIVIGVIVYPSLPAEIPTHWGPSGQIDAWSAKSVWSVFFPVIMAIGLYLLLWLIPYLDPKRGNLIRSKQVYGIVLELVVGLMMVVFVGTLMASFNHGLPMAQILEFGAGVMFIVLGNYLGRVKRNWTMGVRYSWTLSDDTVWAKTNRLGGRLFMGAGVLAVVGAFLSPLAGVAFLLVPALVILPVTYIYSMRLYKQLHPDEMEAPEIPESLDDDPPDGADSADASRSAAARPPSAQPPSAHPVHREVTCPACGAENAPGNSECISCGQPMPRS
jgi:uncharacterized membrane protein